jgi:hypothetical protein
MNGLTTAHAWQVETYASIWSTAVGYDFIIRRRLVSPEGSIEGTITRRYVNISAASMKRFYALCRRLAGRPCDDALTIKSLDWNTLAKAWVVFHTVYAY